MIKIFTNSYGIRLAVTGFLFMICGWIPVRETSARTALPDGHYLFAAVPGIRDYLGYGGHGLLVFDMDHGYKMVKRIPFKGLHPVSGLPSNVKGIAVSLPLRSVFITTLETLERIDLVTGELLWEKPVAHGCDRLSLSPDGKTIYLPSLENKFWNVVDAETGVIVKVLDGFTGSHNTLYGLSGKHIYLADLKDSLVSIVDATTNSVSGKVGPFVNFVRPFTVNGSETKILVNCDGLLGFEVGDLKSGKKLAHIEVGGWEKGPVRRHGCPSHGIGFTPDEKEIWLCDGHNMRLHLFSGKPPYQQLTTIPVRDMPGWITFSLDGRFAFPSSGEVIDVRTREVVAVLKDENYNSVASEKMLEIDFVNGRPVKAGDQFGIGRVRQAGTTGMEPEATFSSRK